MAKLPKYQPDVHYERRVSVIAICDPRTVRKFLTGKQVNATTRAKIQQAIDALAPVVEPVAKSA